jgi:hypothetical protein
MSRSPANPADPHPSPMNQIRVSHLVLRRKNEKPRRITFQTKRDLRIVPLQPSSCNSVSTNFFPETPNVVNGDLAVPDSNQKNRGNQSSLTQSVLKKIEEHVRSDPQPPKSVSQVKP